MSVTSVTREWSGEAGDGIDWAEEVYACVLDDPDTPVDRIVGASGIPRRGSSYRRNAELIARPPALAEHRMLLARVRVRYERPRGDDEAEREDEEQGMHPLVRPATVTFHWERDERPALVDIHGDAITNTAEEPIEPPLTEPHFDLVIVAEQHERYYPLDVARAYGNRLNAEAMIVQADAGGPTYTLAAETVWMPPPTDSRDGLYHQVRYEFYHRFDGWARQVPNLGFRIHPSDGDWSHSAPNWVTLTDEEGMPYAEPVYLDRHATAVVGKPDAVWLTFETKRRADLNQVPVRWPSGGAFLR